MSGIEHALVAPRSCAAPLARYRIALGTGEMLLLLLLLRAALTIVFAIAGVAKLRDLAGTRRAAREFGVPERLAPTVAIVLPLAELATALALLLDRTASAGAATALSLLVLFTAVVAANLARGNRPHCNRFGQLHSAPAGLVTIARNFALAALAALILAQALIATGAYLAAALALAASADLRD